MEITFWIVFFLLCILSVFCTLFHNIIDDEHMNTIMTPLLSTRVKSVVHCASLCETRIECESFTYKSENNSLNDCELYGFYLTPASFTQEDFGRRHYEKQFECEPCDSTYTMSMDSGTDCLIKREDATGSGWLKTNSPDATSFVHTEDSLLDVVTNIDCEIPAEFRCISFIMWAIGPGYLTVTGGDARDTVYHRDIDSGESVHFEFQLFSIRPDQLSEIRFIGYTEVNLGILRVTLWNCICPCVAQDPSS